MSKQLVSWEEIREDFENKETSLLLGKGFSCAVWNRFKDSSLYQEASLQNNGGSFLSEEDRQIFDKLETKNFEKVLATLSTTKEVNEILGAQAHSEILLKIDERYQNIQRSLIQAVERVHIPWRDIPPEVFTTVKKEILKYQNLFYTSYDLLIYWSLTSDGYFEGFRDYFSRNEFQEKSAIEDKRLRVFYIHGGLHLYSEGEKILKITNKGENILEQCKQLWTDPNFRPLFMAEGTWRDKLKFIRNSDYLFFAYNRLKQNTDKLVVLGNPLNLDKSLLDKNHDFNKHLLDAIVESSPKTVAISITDDGDVAQQIKYWEGVMKPDDIQFFDEKSHPLCSPGIRLEAD
ncbi:DUF4917 family protein [Microcoleus sp. AR_TQ3_B6]|uniref:DUF4917 family protein n=1 Tax=Microcoleus sp. AR_TQ3_B6 TaxID=3055284 RepID=UPI002FD6C962